MQLNGRGLLSQVDRDTADTRLKVTEANYQAAIDTVRCAQGQPAGPPRRYDSPRRS